MDKRLIILLLFIPVLAAANSAVTTSYTAPYERCGGIYFVGSVYCSEGYECAKINDYYSQCQPVYVPGSDPPSVTRRDVTPAAAFNPVVGGLGGCQPRRKIDVLETAYPEQFNLLILALVRIYAAPNSDDLSWYQICGIHGAPYIPWQPLTSTGPFNNNLGYCTHNSALFATWHRPYLLLMEQIVCKHAIDIANLFSGTHGSRYRAAAQNLRLPYWDWADGTSNLPAVTVKQSINVTVPALFGVITIEIPNPLYRYVFHPGTTASSNFTGNFIVWQETKRRPDALGSSNNAAASFFMQGFAGSTFTARRSATYSALVATTFANFNDPMEQIHNVVHGTVGGNGHMSYLSTSAFDPIFWLHHCNVDRLTAIYQASKPGVYLVPSAPTATFQRLVFPGSTDNLFTPLYPFRHPDTTWWYSDNVKIASSTWSYNYSYPEVPCEYKARSKEDLQLYAAARIDDLYGPRTRTVNTGFVPSKVGGASVLVRNEYTIEVTFNQTELNGTWTLCFFVGTPKGEPEIWGLDEYLIGSVTSFGTPDGSERKPPKVVKWEVPISESLVKRKIKYTDENIIKYLKDNLCWAIERKGLEIPVSRLKSLQIKVYSAEGQYPLNEAYGLPTYGPPTYLSGITRGKPGGAIGDT